MSTMLTPSAPFPTHWKMSDLQAHLGGVPLDRIRMYPTPGTATEEDMLRLHDKEGVLCELVDGVLVEKVMGSYESAIAMLLGQFMAPYLAQHPLGVVLGADGMLRLMPGKTRIPDVSFLRWERFSGRTRPKERVWPLAPDIAVEILSAGNTEAEIELKLDEYFAAGTELAWIIDPAKRTAQIFTSRHDATEIDEHGSLSGGNVLPGFVLPLRKLLDFFPAE